MHAGNGAGEKKKKRKRERERELVHIIRASLYTDRRPELIRRT